MSEQNQNSTSYYREKDINEAQLKVNHIKAIADLSTKQAIAYAKCNGISLGSIYRWKRRYERKEPDGLIRRSRADKGKLRSCSEELEKIIQDKYLQPTRPSPRRVHSEIVLLQKEQGRPAPSYTTVRKVIDRIPKDVVELTRYGKKNNGSMPIEIKKMNSCKFGKIIVKLINITEKFTAGLLWVKKLISLV